MASSGFANCAVAGKAQNSIALARIKDEVFFMVGLSVEIYKTEGTTVYKYLIKCDDLTLKG
jgi:hypothetical protein